MIIFGTLPNWKDRFEHIDIMSNAWSFAWQHKDAPKLRIYANTLYPWENKYYIVIIQKRSSTSGFVNRIDLKCHSTYFKKSIITPARLLLRMPVGGIPHTVGETLRFYAIPCQGSSFQLHIFLSIIAT